MIKISGRVTRCCVALFLVLTSVSAVQKKMDSINDLKKINFGQSVSKHSILLLFWFATIIDIDDNNIIQLPFDVDNEDYGSHHYCNIERLLDQLPAGNEYRYFTVGNLNQDKSSVKLPHYVLHPLAEYQGRNRDRILFRVRTQIRENRIVHRVDQVYMTQHIEHQMEYDPDHTYVITTNLLRQIREFSVGENQQPLSYLRSLFGSNADVSRIRNTWGDFASLGLLLFIVIQERLSPSQYNRPGNNVQAANNHVPENNYTGGNKYKPQKNSTLDKKPTQENYSTQDKKHAQENNKKQQENRHTAENNPTLDNKPTQENNKEQQENRHTAENNSILDEKNTEAENNQKQPENNHTLKSDNTLKNFIPQNDHTPKSNYIQENNDTQLNDGPKNNSRVEIKYSPENNYRLQNTYRLQYRRTDWDDGASVNWCLFIFVLICIFIHGCFCMLGL